MEIFDFFQNRHIAEMAYFWAGTALPIITIGAIIFAAFQVRYAKQQLEQSKNYSKITAQQAQATLLLKLIEIWDTDELINSKLATNAFESRERDIVYSRHKELSDNQIKIKLKEHYRATIGELRLSDNERYIAMMRLLSFFETVGLFVEKEYVLLSDIDGLFRGPILDVGLIWERHIKEDKRLEKGVPDGLYENALALVSRIEKSCPQ